jgi:hypothetical protein
MENLRARRARTQPAQAFAATEVGVAFEVKDGAPGSRGHGISPDAA